MSEINSIANGTFTIGQTSATNFVAGPGIKIDEPSAGTVRIGNDETVLYSINPSSATTADVTLSESRMNFDHIAISMFDDNYNTFNFNMVPERPTCRSMGAYNAGAQWMGLRAIEVSALNDTTLTISDTPQMSFTSAGAFRNFGHGKYGKIYKVVGIGRKEV